MRVPLAPSGLRAEDIAAVDEVLKSGNLTMGEQVSSFEVEMANYLGTKYFVMVNSGSSANLAIIEALLRPSKSEPKLEIGDSVLVPSIAWPTTIWPLIQLGLNPIFVDIEPNSLAIDLRKAQGVLDANSTKKIKAIFPIHPLGLGISNKGLEDFATRNELCLINDMCESLGSWQEDEHSGTVGIMSSFSFYFSHHMTTMEGGGIATNDSDVYDDLKSIRSHGWSRDRSDIDEWSIDVHPSMRKFTFISTGYNIRPMEIQAAIGRRQLASLERFVEKRRLNVAKVLGALKKSNLKVIGAPAHSSIEDFRQHSWMHIPIYISSKNSAYYRNVVVRFLEDSGIETRPPLTGNFLRQPAMIKYLKESVNGLDFANSDDISSSTFLVGCHHDLSDTQISYLCEKLIAASNLIQQ